MDTKKVTVGPNESLEVELLGSGYKIQLTHLLDDDAHAVQLWGVNCDLDGEMPGLYYPVAAEAGEWPAALRAPEATTDA